MQNQIERLQTCPKNILEKIEILISDNCSTDNTQEIVENAIRGGFQCTYIRNEKNLGMDGNFVSCFRKASAKYVWLLGDDDVIIVESLIKIVRKLETCNYGLFHISNSSNGSNKEFVEYTDDDDYCKHVSYMFTFISSNIAQTKYVREVPFEKYMGTWFTLIPLYFASMHGENVNAIANIKVFDDAIDAKRNGGYNYFQVFATNYLNILKEFESKGYFSHKSCKYMKKRILKDFIVDYYIDYSLLRKPSNYKTEKSTQILLRNYWMEPYFYSTIIVKLFERFCNMMRKIKRLFVKN